MPQNLAGWITEITGALYQIVPQATLTIIVGVGVIFSLAVVVGKRFMKLGR
jgi:hypothetical protein